MKPPQQTGPKREITDLTACRALFAAWVFIYHVDLHTQFAHYLGPYAGMIRHGYLGVDGFFILSGMILTQVHPELRQSTKTYRRFWLKRLGRIYPVHLAVLVMLGVFVVTGAVMGVVPRDPSRFGLFALLENLLLVQSWGFGSQWSWNYPAWTISTEWAGYLLFPWMLRISSKLGTLVSGQIALCCVPVIGILSANTGHGLNVAGIWSMLRLFPELIIGIQAARLVSGVADLMPGRLLAGIGVGLALLGLRFNGDLVAVLGLVLVLFGLLAQADGERPPVFRWFPWLRSLGLLSYSFYMSFATSELLVTQAFRHLHRDPAVDKLLFAALMTGVTFAIALVLHVLVENPCRRFVDARLAGPKPKQPKPGAGGNPVPGSSQSPAR